MTFKQPSNTEPNMHKRAILLLVVPVVLVAGAGVLLSQGVPNTDGLPDISGDWVGKAAFKGFEE